MSYPIIFGITVWSSFESDTAAATGDVPLPGYDDSPLGGHALFAIGYDQPRQKIKFLNSWERGATMAAERSITHTSMMCS